MVTLVEGQHYTIDKWTEINGTQHDNYNCRKCQYSTLFKEKMLEHYKKQNLHQHRWGFSKPEGEQTKDSALKY